MRVTPRVHSPRQSLHALVDRRVLEVSGGGQLLAALQENSDVTVHVITAQQPGTVTWEREITDCVERHGEVGWGGGSRVKQITYGEVVKQLGQGIK